MKMKSNILAVQSQISYKMGTIWFSINSPYIKHNSFPNPIDSTDLLNTFCRPDYQYYTAVLWKRAYIQILMLWKHSTKLAELVYLYLMME